METQKVFVNEEDKATLVCPHCGFYKDVNVAKFKNRVDPLKVRCTCRSTFAVSLEFRRARRKETNLKGYYCRLPVCKAWSHMVVKNVSLLGVGFVTLECHNLKKGDVVKVKFTLDDGCLSEIEREVIVRRLSGNHFIGGEFRDAVQFDKALGFYLMSGPKRRPSTRAETWGTTGTRLLGPLYPRARARRHA